MHKRILGIVALFCAFCVMAASAQTVEPISQPHVHYVNNSGQPCAGCKLYSYVAGSTTALATYTDSTGSAQNPNPVVLGLDGGANIWLGVATYKFILKDAAGNTLWTVDNVPGATAPTPPTPTPGVSGNVLYNNGGAMGAATNLNWNPTTNILSGNILQATATGASLPSGGTNGAYLTWGGSATVGTESTIFYNLHDGSGPGGFEWINSNPGYPQVQLMYLDQYGNLVGGNNIQSTGDLYAQASGAGTVHAAQLTGNAATATTATTAAALAATPTVCSAGQVPSGVDAHGNAVGCATVVTGSSVHLINHSACSPPNTTDGSCTGTITGFSFADAGYSVTVTMMSTSGAWVFMTVTAKASNSFNYALTCTFNCSSVGTLTADISLFHP